MQCGISLIKHVNKALLWLEILPQVPSDPGERQRSHAHCCFFGERPHSKRGKPRILAQAIA